MGYSEENLTLTATGDSLVTRKFSIYSENNFLSVIKLLRDGDITFTNLETLIHEYEGYAAAESGGTWMASPPYIANELKWAGINVVSRANNHAMDYSATGMRTTSRFLDKAGIAHAGVGESLSEARLPKYIETRGGRVGLISVSSTFPSHALAGKGKDGIPSRPGLNGLRHTTVNNINSTTAEKLIKIASSLGLKVRNVSDSEFILFGNRFFISDENKNYEKMNKNDFIANLKSVNDAKRQADLVFVSLHAHESKKDREVPADFIQEFSQACIDEGADAIIGHGPEVLRGIEIYEGKPIFYSLGCFFLQNETVNRHPSDLYEKYGLSFQATPADLHDIREEKSFLNGSKWFTKESIWWEGLIAKCIFSNGQVEEIRLYPISLGFGETRSKRGRPVIADPTEGEKIINRVKNLSRPFNTDIDLIDGVGFVKIR